MPRPSGITPRAILLGCLGLTTALLSGCAGTRATRISNQGDCVGKYPFGAVAFDAGCLFASPGEYHSATGAVRMLGLVSIPFDLAVDAILSPFDLILWPCGLDKTEPARRSPTRGAAGSGDQPPAAIRP